MTVKECYEVMGGDYDEIMHRLMTEERVTKFLGKVLNDQNYELLCTSIAEKNMPDAFRAAHTIKGICKNLALTRLGDSASELAEVLRNRESYGEDIEPAFSKVKEDYALVKDSITTLLGN